MTLPDATRHMLRAAWSRPEADVVADLMDRLALDGTARAGVSAHAARLVAEVRRRSRPTIMEAFLAEYGLSTAEGIGLMCLAEALLRTPDADTIDALIRDKIEPSDWGAHLGHSSSSLVNASTWALMLTGRVLDDDPGRPAAALRGLIRRAGEPVVRTAVGQAMKLLGRQFVLGETIGDAMRTARPMEAKGFTYSYDMLGEAARTEADALRYEAAYAAAIKAIAGAATGDVRSSPGISVKLSALHPRYESTHRAAVMAELVPRVAGLAVAAAAAKIGFNIDAEEQDRLELSLDVIGAVLADPALTGWDGFGIVVQAYGRRAVPVIEHLDDLARKLGRRLMVRLVKGAYWDSEIKQAQEAGVETFPVFTRKATTDLSYLACAQMLLERRARLYPQFATHNAHSTAAVLAMAGNDRDGFEFQRLHGMGEALHDTLHAAEGTRCRIYAPVGAHRDLLAYLVRRLLENGANSSFVNQIVDESIPPERIAADPVAAVAALGGAIENPGIAQPPALFGESRANSRGVRVTEPASLAPLLAAREAFAGATWTAAPMVPGHAPTGAARAVVSPADLSRTVGTVTEATAADVAGALAVAPQGFAAWAATPVAERAAALRRAADLYERHMAEFCAILAREAGKTIADAVAEVREAVDFLRYYAAEAERVEPLTAAPRGVIVCISPWNFPLAIFTGQIAAALGAGNAVIAKPAEQTPLVAARATALLHEAGVRADALMLLPGDGPGVGAPLTAAAGIAGVCFTGSTEVAQLIHRALAANAGPDALLIAETGGLNAMVVDSTALPEQAVRDILASAFQSAGQRCSALRMLYVQDEAHDRLMTMLKGAMDCLTLGDPWDPATDIGPVIDAEAREGIAAHVAAASARGALVKAMEVPEAGHFCGPAVIAVDGIAALEREVFGPVLHVARFRARDLDAVVDAINARGYGLTFGLHTRIDDRVQQVVERLRVGNVYVNRNQIGAVVGVQPFGGEGLSGTGPKAGGPLYLPRFRRGAVVETTGVPTGAPLSATAVAAALAAVAKAEWTVGDRLTAVRMAAGDLVPALATFDAAARDLPGPTGESNRWSLHPRGPALCLGATPDAAAAQAALALAAGCPTVVVAGGHPVLDRLAAAGAPLRVLDGTVAPETLADLSGLAVVAATGDAAWTGALRRALAERAGPIMPLVTALDDPAAFWHERHLCIDTTAAGGNASLLAAVA